MDAGPFEVKASASARRARLAGRNAPTAIAPFEAAATSVIGSPPVEPVKAPENCGSLRPLARPRRSAAGRVCQMSGELEEASSVPSAANSARSPSKSGRRNPYSVIARLGESETEECSANPCDGHAVSEAHLQPCARSLRRAKRAEVPRVEYEKRAACASRLSTREAHGLHVRRRLGRQRVPIARRDQPFVYQVAPHAHGEGAVPDVRACVLQVDAAGRY